MAAESEIPLALKGRCTVLQDFHGLGPLVSSLVVGTALTLAATIAANDYLDFDPDAPMPWWGVGAMLLMIAVLIVILIAGAVLGWWLWEKLFPKTRGFYGETYWHAGPEGLQIDQVCQLPWSQVMATESVPDDDTHMIVHTLGLGTLMLDLHSSAEWEELHQLIQHYLVSSSDAANPVFRAQVFNWPRFACWILAGYILPVVMLYYALPENSKGFLGVLVMVFVLAPLVAWLIWAIPVSFGLGILGARKVRAFRCVGHTLYCLEDQRSIDLHTARIKLRKAWWGFGPKFDFISVLPREGRRLDLIPDENETEGLLRRLQHAADLIPADFQSPRID